MSFFSNVVDQIFKSRREKAKYREISNDPEVKEKSLYYGGHSIFNSILTLVLSVVAVFLLSMAMGGDSALLMIMGLLFGILFGVAALGTFISALIGMIQQFKMNKRGIRWVALFFFLLSIVGVAVAAFVILSMQK